MGGGDSRILGQILLIESLVAQLPNKASMLQFAARGLEQVPGIQGVWFQEEPFLAGTQPVKAFEIRYNGHFHAALCFLVSDEGLFEPLVPYLKNLAFMLGLVLDERMQREDNERYSTQLEQLVEARTRALRKASAAVEQSPIAIFITDTAGVIEYVNQAFCEYTGYSAEEALGRTPSLLKSGEHSAEFYRELWESLAQGRTWRGRFHNRRKDGELYWEQAIISPLRDADGQISNYLASKENITEALRLENEHRQLQLQVARTQRLESLGSLAGGVAHDMNNVLAAILALANVQQMEAPEGSPLRRTLDTIATACLRGRTLVHGLLGFARQDLAEESLLDLNALIKEEVTLLEHTTMQRVNLRLELQEGLWPLKGDPAALSHALMNLCVNAVDALAGGGTLTLKTLNVGTSQIRLEVQDDGCGMPKEVLERVFDPFFTTKDPGKGTGLGLPIVYRTVAAHHGQIDIQSAPGLGTQVTILLPASQEGRGPSGREALEGNGDPVLRVLLVDDDDLIQEAVGSLLQVLGHSTAIAGCGEVALELLEQGLACDVVILDLHMPGLGGAKTLSRLRTLRPELPVLLATGNADQEAVRLVGAHTSVTLLPKPYALGELRRHLAKISRS